MFYISRTVERHAIAAFRSVHMMSEVGRKRSGFVRWPLLREGENIQSLAARTGTVAQSFHAPSRRRTTSNSPK
jgi:hypothetical protein